MDYLEIFKMARDRPRMLGLDGSFVAAAAFVNGCDAGNSWRLLDGFREWLATGLGDGANLSWQALVVRHSLSGGSPNSPAELVGEGENSVAVARLFELLEEFWEVRQKRSLAGIFAQYTKVFG
ncbi:hypothetical protein [Lentzea albidocapillata]|uniref:Uncharacterized protein n=1 Tax=Lentzea albidocapillata TaxID=40571 RepID=A0A1W2FTA7_9PSEU|nr:hypothetical protein [Lentzea albidocapillata]SMD25207.1 hypothetical protein SAMN05660733_08044 [Lentzea albidocapillata]